jgi:hypothetical protein
MFQMIKQTYLMIAIKYCYPLDNSTSSHVIQKRSNSGFENQPLSSYDSLQETQGEKPEGSRAAFRDPGLPGTFWFLSRGVSEGVMGT